MTGHSTKTAAVGVVVIGRNEGERLIACLNSAAGEGRRLVYVDSGSTDGSIEAAQALGADVVSLDMSVPFTAARARNAGYARLKENAAPGYVQFVDGDCEIVEGWIEKAAAFLEANAAIAVACGRRREKFPERTVYNRLCDREWDTPIGEAEACGGDALMRADAFEAVGGYRDSLIAGEEPELCVRLRADGWKIFRLDEEMTRHDIAMTSIGQWMKRARRAGHAFAEVSDIHRSKPENIWTKETIRAFFWTGALLAVLLAGLVLHPLLWFGLGVFPLQIARMAMRSGGKRDDWMHAALIMAQKPWEAAGAAQYWFGRLTGKNQRLIEYKS